LVPLCLERAGVVPLIVSITVSDVGRDVVFLHALLPHVSRISRLSLKGYSSIEGVADDLPGFFAFTIPNLTSLELEQTTQPPATFPPNGISAPPLFQSVSKLKSLHLTRTPLYPAVFTITSLVELKLVGYTTPFHFGRFIEFLQSNPTLELVTIDLRFAEGSVRVAPERTTSLPQLRRLAFTCGSAADTRGLLSCVTLRRSVSIAIQGSQSNLCADLAPFLPPPSTPIWELFAPITTIKYRVSPRRFHISNGDGELSFQSHRTPPMYNEINLFVTGTVREFHVNAHYLGPGYDYLSWPLRRLPALEALVLSEMRLPPGSLSALANEPVLCPSLKTIAFFDCQMTADAMRELEGVLARRRYSTAARLYRVVIVNNTHALPDLQLIHQLRGLALRVDVGVGDELPDLL